MLWDDEEPISLEESERYLAICRGSPPDPEPYNRGWKDHEMGKAFHEGPRPSNTVEALSWRIGWNDRALSMR